MSLQIALYQIQERIAKIPKQAIREALQFQYLTGTRISEVIGKYAITKEDHLISQYNGEEIAIFQVHTAKHNGRIRNIALPLSSPQVKDVLKKFNEVEKGRIYKAKMRTVTAYCEEYFKGQTYLIEAYTNENKMKIKEHEREGRTHLLRHLRYTEMLTKYHFSETDTDIFFGWIPRNMGKRYAYQLWLEWSCYIDKLL